MPETESDSSSELSVGKLNAKLGLSKVAGQWAQLGFAGLMAVAFGFILFWLRTDAKEQLKQQSIERSEDREMRKELATIQSSSMEKLANAIGEFRTEIKVRDEKLTTTLDRLADKIDKMR